MKKNVKKDLSQNLEKVTLEITMLRDPDSGDSYIVIEDFIDALHAQ
ncbi:MAG: hypothetical protein AAF985_10880 [Bacteroidota bacterium]